MEITVVGFDPSMRGWGIAEGSLDLESGYLSNLNLAVIDSQETKGKQVRQNSKDLQTAEQLAGQAIAAAQRAKVIFVETPVGSQSASAMKSYGMCVGILGSIRALGIPIIEVTATEVKHTFTGDKYATKAEMISKALSLYPDTQFPTHNGKISAGKAEHVADAIAAIHAGVHTPVFQNLRRLYTGA